MDRSIKEKAEKIKAYVQNSQCANDFFLMLLIPLIAITGFGLGRLSALDASTDIPNVIISTPSSVISTPEETSETIVPKEGGAAGAYVGSENSDKYHLPWCSGAQRILTENKVWFDSKVAAEDAGYEPAGNCPGI